MGTEISINVRTTVKWTVLGSAKVLKDFYEEHHFLLYTNLYILVSIMHNMWQSYFLNNTFKLYQQNQYPNQ